MSWDVQLLKSAADSDVDSPLGPVHEVRTSISKIHPGVDWTDPAWGVLEGNDWSIELNTGTAPLISSIMLHVRGSGDPLPAIAALCKSTGWSAMDLSTGELIDPDEPSHDGWNDFQKFRDGITVAFGTDHGDGTSLPLAHLEVEGTILRYSRGHAAARTHDLGKASAVRFERGINWVTVVLAVLVVAAGLGLKSFVPLPWLGWVFLTIGGLAGLLFAIAAPTDWLVIEEATARSRYPLFGNPPEMLAFRAAVETIRQAGDL